MSGKAARIRENRDALDVDITWQPAADLPPLVINLPAMFAELWESR